MSNEKKQAKDTVFEALVTAFTFVSALAWRDTLVKLLEEVLPEETNRLWAEVAITLLITAISVTFIYFLVKTERIVDNKFGLQEDKEGNEDT